MDGPNPRKSDLNTLALAAGQAKHWTPQELATQLGLPTLTGMVNLVFSYQGGRNDVIIANGSLDQTKTYVFEIKMEGVNKSLGKGLKDWDVSNGNDTMISLLNSDEQDEDLSITFYFDGGHYKLPVHLNAGGSAMFNMSDIIMMQQPDSDGNKIPPGTLHGTAVLSAASTVPQWVNVGVSVGIFNVSTATCGGHCPYCTNFVDFLVVADIGTASVGQNTEFSSWAEKSDSTWIDYTLQSQWTSSDIQVAPPSCCTVGAFTGVSPGSFTANESATLEGGTGDCPEDCNPSDFADGATGLIQKPTSLQFISVSVLPDGSTGAFGCPPSKNYGIRIDIKYQVLDQQSPAQPIRSSNMTPHENGTLFNGAAYDNNVGPVADYPTSGTTTASDGTFHDVPFGYCQNLPIDTAKTATQNLTVIIGANSYAVRSQNWSVTAPGSQSFGHGTITNTITSPGTGSDVSATR